LKPLLRLLSYKTRKTLYFNKYQPLIDQVRAHPCEDKHECPTCLANIYIIGKASIDYGINPEQEAEEMYEP
jgi:hypothetical protein